MIPAELWPLLSEVAARLSRVRSVSTVVLFGSAARGELARGSDIDLMVVFDAPHDPEVGGELEEAHHALAGVRTERRLQLVAAGSGLRLDPDLLASIAREGVVLYGRPLVLTPEGLALSPRDLFTYSMEGMGQAEKTRLHRALFGYRVRRRVGKRTYVSESEGVAGPLGARRVGKGVLMVSAERSRELEAVFEGLGVAHTRARVWE